MLYSSNGRFSNANICSSDISSTCGWNRPTGFSIVRSVDGFPFSISKAIWWHLECRSSVVLPVKLLKWEWDIYFLNRCFCKIKRYKNARLQIVKTFRRCEDHLKARGTYVLKKIIKSWALSLIFASNKNNLRTLFGLKFEKLRMREGFLHILNVIIKKRLMAKG